MKLEASTPRGGILIDAVNATEGDRPNTYGHPSNNLTCAGHIKAVLRGHNSQGGRYISPGEWEAIDLVITKLSRIVTGPHYHRDSYVDGAAYLAIAGELGGVNARFDTDATRPLTGDSSSVHTPIPPGDTVSRTEDGEGDDRGRSSGKVGGGKRPAVHGSKRPVPNKNARR